MAAALDVALGWWDSMFAAGMGEARAVLPFPVHRGTDPAE
jgi:hypothetical protein